MGEYIQYKFGLCSRDDEFFSPQLGMVIMSNSRVYDQKAMYEIRIIGRLDQTWSEWFDGFSITFQGAETIMVGEVIDQAALFGVLTKLNDLGLPLMSVLRVE